MPEGSAFQGCYEKLCNLQIIRPWEFVLFIFGTAVSLISDQQLVKEESSIKHEKLGFLYTNTLLRAPTI